MFLYARRAQEGIDKLCKSQFVKLYDEENDYFYYKEKAKDQIKNQQ